MACRSERFDGLGAWERLGCTENTVNTRVSIPIADASACGFCDNVVVADMQTVPHLQVKSCMSCI
ncbi:hypothetical protein EYF80_043555 [Liparis tanakae]|uniref:Uncharacterized protein n=1 Tax=Liparis tanakae TaxID=230148 RepID=A0A4Z2G147_9TELE|nr:hypothetical protein EYF80_043555 [Liparis tanakae]